MAGLRERQKADRHRRILEAAAALFRRSGYRHVKMEAIATAAGVSIGTIYNYYRNKGDLLVAIVSMEVHDVLAAGEEIVARPPRDAGRAVHDLISIYLEHSLVYLSKEMWRHAMAISTQQPDTPSGEIYTELDGRLADQVCALIARLKALGAVREETDERAVGELIFNNTNMMFIQFVKDEAMPVSALLDRIGRQNAPLIGLIGTPARG